MTDERLGRHEQFDERSKAYPIRALISSATKPRSYSWKCPVTLNQGNESACVGFSFAHDIAARPVSGVVTNETGRLIYREACRIDEWPENDAGPDMSFGTSVLAGVKTLMTLGHYSSYHWAFTFDELLLALGYKGPVVLGIPWFASMFEPDEKGVIKVGGSEVGGHAILANGVSLSQRLVRLHNSWGGDFGIQGECFIGFDDLAKLLKQGGEAVIPVRR